MLEKEGIFAGPSAALNVAGAIKVVRMLKEGGLENPTVVTIICDGGGGYMEKLWDEKWRAEKGIEVWGAGEEGGGLEELLERMDDGDYVEKAEDKFFEGHVGGS